jgi:octaprenyl-diphosphate synthase
LALLFSPAESVMDQVVSAIPSASFNFYAPIRSDLEQVEQVLLQTLTNPRPGVIPLIRHLEKYRGKRLRPVLLLLTAHACGKVSHAHHVLGAVVEMIHTATLVHDDVLDEAGTRRHVQTVNALWGNKASILLGDYLFTHAFHLTSTLGDADACRIIGEATNRVCAGELHQICQRGNLSLSEDEYFDIIDGKTAELTACCTRLGRCTRVNRRPWLPLSHVMAGISAWRFRSRMTFSISSARNRPPVNPLAPISNSAN